MYVLVRAFSYAYEGCGMCMRLLTLTKDVDFERKILSNGNNFNLKRNNIILLQSVRNDSMVSVRAEQTLLEFSTGLTPVLL
jgi:hypothetical protein